MINRDFYNCLTLIFNYIREPLPKRFDRTDAGKKIHFASAITLLGYTDSEGAAGASYLDITGFIIKYGANVATDLEELWKRVVFNICVNNRDDHLRNHGFLLTETGWILSPAYDVNPNEYGTGLSLNISEQDNSIDLDLALSVAPYFRLKYATATHIIEHIIKTLECWKDLATKYKLSRAEQERMELVFKLK